MCSGYSKKICHAMPKKYWTRHYGSNMSDFVSLQEGQQKHNAMNVQMIRGDVALDIRYFASFAEGEDFQPAFRAALNELIARVAVSS
jgi:hypothetical protein